MAQIIGHELTFGYEGQRVCEHVSFRIEAGDYFCIVGNNGSGKSTLMKGLLGLKNPDSGSVEYGDGVRQRDIGYLPQKTDAQKDFPASVEEIVLSGYAAVNGLRPFYSRVQKSEAQLNMKQMGVDSLRRRSFSALSGGQQQRTLLARALCAADKILLLDEPVAGLDPAATEEMYDLIEHLNRRHGITVVMITHDIPAVLRYATKVLHMGKAPTCFQSVSEYRKSDFFPEREKNV